MNSRFKLKPNKTAFVYFNFLKLTAIIVFTGLMLIFLSFFLNEVLGNFLFPVIALILFLMISITVFNYFNLNISFNKANYYFFDSKIIIERGTMFSDNSIELIIKNITHVTLVKPIISNKLFKTGNMLIELAGGTGTEAFMRYIDFPDKTYNELIKLMKENGFQLNKQKLIQKEKPNILGVILQTLGLIVGLFFLLIYVSGSFIALLPVIGLIPLILLLLLLAVIIFISIFINFMNLLKRTYFIFDDTIVYKEGFLTKVQSFIPVENLADSTTTQSLIEKILDIHNIKISCQGASHEIIFKNLNNGEKMESNIDSLIKNMEPLITTKKSITPTKLTETQPIQEKINFNQTTTYSTKMNLIRTIFPPIITLIIPFILIFLIGLIFIEILFFSLPALVLLIPILLIILIPLIIQVTFTNYNVLEKGINEKFNFLNKRNIEFSNDKITGLVIKKNFIDNFFNTFTAVFWSIGSGTNINFKNINFSLETKKMLLEKLGFNQEETIHEINSSFNAIELIKANLLLSLITLTALISTIIFAFIINPISLILTILILISIMILIVYKKLFYSTSKIIFTKNYAYFKAGIFFINEYYSLYNNIKDITSTKYAFSSKGLIKFNVAGETTIQDENQQHKMTAVSLSGGHRNIQTTSLLQPHNFVIQYVSEIDFKKELIDLIFYKKPLKQEIDSLNETKIQQKTILFTKPSLKNPLFVHGILLASIPLIASIILFPLSLILWNLFLIQLIWIYLSTKAKSYSIKEFKASKNKGILYKTQTTILFTKIDHITKNQQILNKLFNNGNIQIFTTGSRLPEITIKNIPNFKEFHEKLDESYE